MSVSNLLLLFHHFSSYINNNKRLLTKSINEKWKGKLNYNKNYNNLPSIETIDDDLCEP
jgi:hypothetical protein